METSTATPEQVPEQVQRVVKWYTQGLLTEEELVQLLKYSAGTPVGRSGGVGSSPSTWR